MAARRKPAGQTQAERDRISLGRIEAFLDQAIADSLMCPSCRERFSVKDIAPGTLKALEIRYARLRPSLQAVEQTVIDPRDKADPQLLFRQMVAILAANPALLDRLVAAVHQHRAENAQEHAPAGPESSGNVLPSQGDSLH